jgi:hypothetical protein
MPDAVDVLAKLKEREERMTKRNEKLAEDLANNKLRLREVKKRIRAIERVNKKIAQKRTES